jgi:hypothetical protein
MHNGQHRVSHPMCMAMRAAGLLRFLQLRAYLVATGVQADEQLVQQVELPAQPYICWQLVLRERCLDALWMQPAA